MGRRYSQLPGKERGCWRRSEDARDWRGDTTPHRHSARAPGQLAETSSVEFRCSETQHLSKPRNDTQFCNVWDLVQSSWS